MTTREELCKKITEVFPDIGVCGIDLDVSFDEKNKAWAVDLKKGEHHLKTFLEISEAESCLAGKQCISLGLQVAQLKENIKEMSRVLLYRHEGNSIYATETKKMPGLRREKAPAREMRMHYGVAGSSCGGG